MKSLLIAVSIFISAGAAADSLDAFAGTWSGKGTYILEGDLYQCGGFEMAFSKTAEKFVFEVGSRACDKHSEKFERVELYFHDNGMFYRDEKAVEYKVGSYANGQMELSYDMPDSAGGIRHWRMSMRAEGNNLMYEERRIMDNNVTPTISFAGLAQKK